ncbi:MAG TPA: serine/threonine-protein kinase [Gemmataceae bacterium]|nr:serine/threonine-protein kinase [Gemmataceae bacterium]
MSTLTAHLKDGRTVEYLPEPIGEGGMKRAYFTADRQSVLLFFKDKGTAKDPNRMARLDAILGKFNPTTHPTTGKYFGDLFCWLTGIVVQPELGVMTPAYPHNFFFATGNWQGKEKEGKWFSSPKLRKLLPPAERGTWLSYLQIGILMARAVRKMHLTGLAHSDLSCKNILLDPPGGKCSVIDIDSLVVPGVYPPDVLGTPGYFAPEVLATQHLPLEDPKRRLPSNLTDLHALAVLIYEYLLRRHPLRGPKVNAPTAEDDERLSMGEKALFIENPKDTSNRPKSGLGVTYDQLGPYLPKVIERAFVEGLHDPSARPTANEWERALYRSSDLLIPCGNGSCEEKWFLLQDGHKPKCPWCGWRMQSATPVLDFHFPARSGQYRAEQHALVGWDGRRLHRWHVYQRVDPVEGVDQEVLAYVRFYQGRWILINKGLDGMISPAGNPVPRGQACALKEGDEVHLARGDHGRLVSVRMIP